MAGPARRASSRTAVERAAPQRVRPERRTQEERRAQTRHQLCEAAVQSLAEIGFERLTTSIIARRAGVSNGALAHHFPTKDDILVAAFAHLLDGWNVRRERFAAEVVGTATMERLLRYLWRDVFGRADYVASVEMMLAARHHPALRERMQVVLANWTVARDDIFRRLVPLDDRSARLTTFLQLNFCVLRGLALFGGLNEDKALEERVLKMWIGIADDYLSAQTNPKTRRKAPTLRSPRP